MMRVIYTKVKANNPNHLVTAAIAGGMWQPPRYDLENSHQYIDYINMMTYGMVSNNGYYQNALKRSTTYANPTNVAGKTLTSCSIEESIEIYNSYGIPNSRIIVGVAFYGIKQIRSYDSVSQTW
jgi:chitinase